LPWRRFRSGAGRLKVPPVSLRLPAFRAAPPRRQSCRHRPGPGPGIAAQPPRRRPV